MQNSQWQQTFCAVVGRDLDGKMHIGIFKSPTQSGFNIQQSESSRIQDMGVSMTGIHIKEGQSRSYRATLLIYTAEPSVVEENKDPNLWFVFVPREVGTTQWIKIDPHDIFGVMCHDMLEEYFDEIGEPPIEHDA